MYHISLNRATDMSVSAGANLLQLDSPDSCIKNALFLEKIFSKIVQVCYHSSMTKKEDILKAIEERFGTDSPVLTSDIEELFPNTPRRTLFSQIASLVDSGRLSRYDTGVYYISTQTLAGETTLDPARVVERKYLVDAKGTCGYWSGASLDNSIGLSTQVPARLEVVTNNTSTNQRTVKVGGWAECLVKKARSVVDDSNVQACQILDVLCRRSPIEMDEGQRSTLTQLANGISAAELYVLSLDWPQKVTRRITEGVACGVFA